VDPVISPANLSQSYTTDYYYYATAGGAKIWVSTLRHDTYTCADSHAYLHFSLSPVEEVFNYHADRPVHRRPASGLLWE